jgi:hypothetical protein
MASDPVSSFVQTLCQMERLGGRCLRTNECTWEVMDVGQWSESQQASLRAKFPRIAAVVTANRKSLSGFSILLRLQRAPHMWTSLLVCAIMATATITIARAFRVQY